MEDVLTAVCNSICAILEAVASFDIMKVDTNKLAMFWQLAADAYRVAAPAVKIIVGFVGRLAAR